jgi:hypothetical protein
MKKMMMVIIMSMMKMAPAMMVFFGIVMHVSPLLEHVLLISTGAKSPNVNLLHSFYRT